MKIELEDEASSLQSLKDEVPMRCWAAYLAFETNCDECTNERHRRKRVLNDTATRLHADFALAPLVTPNNKPRYQASQQRAELFARVKKTQVLWVQAEDFPISGEIATYDETKLQTKRREWLKRHDQSYQRHHGSLPAGHGTTSPLYYYRGQKTQHLQIHGGAYCRMDPGSSGRHPRGELH